MGVTAPWHPIVSTTMDTFEEQLRTLRRTIVLKAPFCSGTASVDQDELLLFYGKENGTPG